MQDFRIALVTGAAHRLGRIFALTLARRGYAILLHCHHSVDKANQTSDEIRKLGVPVSVVEADLEDLKSVDLVYSFVDKMNYPLAVLVNSVGVMKKQEISTLDQKDWDSTFAINVRAPAFLCQQAAKRMEDGGCIINITDAGLGKYWTGYPAYISSKAALEALTLVLAKSYAPKIRVNTIAPGFVLPSDKISADEWERLIGRVPLKRPVFENDLSCALEYLLDNKSVTGQTIVVDGGNSLV